MKRIGKNQGLIDEIIADENLENSIKTVLRGSDRKRTPIGRYILNNKEQVKQQLTHEIRTGTFRLAGYYEREITERGKVRRIQSVDIYRRIGCHAIMNIVEQYVYAKYIRTTGASIKNRGMHDLLNYIRRDMKENPEKMRYIYKGDVRKFYENIGQEFMMFCLRRMFKDKILLTMLERFVRMTPNGLSIGLRSSQAFGNILLSMFLDHYIKDKVGVENYYRYCDDIDAHFATKKECWEARNIIHERVKMIDLEIKPNERVFPIESGLDFLGYVIYPTHTLLRKRNKQNAARKLHKVKSTKRRIQLIASLYGQCKHGNCRNLFKTLTGISMEEYKRLKSLGIKPKYLDGKKRFACGEINISELEGEEFLVLDFETDIITSPQMKDFERKVENATRRLQNYADRGETPPPTFTYPEDITKPKGKYVVHIRRKNGRECKFFTGDSENYSILDQMRAVGLPIYASVEAIKGRSFTRYRLC